MFLTSHSNYFGQCSLLCIFLHRILYLYSIQYTVYSIQYTVYSICVCVCVCVRVRVRVRVWVGVCVCVGVVFNIGES